MSIDFDALEAELEWCGHAVVTKKEGLELIRLARCATKRATDMSPFFTNAAQMIDFERAIKKINDELAKVFIPRKEHQNDV